MLHSLAFVLARGQDLPGEGADWSALASAQERGPSRGRALRLFRLPEHWPGNLDALVTSGCATIAGDDPLGGPGERRALVCDAVVPELEVASLWMGVYALSGTGPREGAVVRLLDRFPLQEAANETCWFYPTDNGTYLCWSNPLALSLAPGWLPEQDPQADPIAYDRGAVHVLWSLMADDAALTCVGLTYQGRRIEWPLLSRRPDPRATWTWFEVDTMADPSYRERASLTVVPP